MSPNTPYPVDDARVGAESSPRRSRASVLPRGNRKVLMIAYAFPPIGGSGVERSVKFAKYLPQFGWQPTVWTADEVAALPRGPAHCDDQPPEAVVCPRNAGSGILAMRRSPRGFVNARAGEGLTAAASKFAKAIDWRLEAWHSATSLPDDCIPWARCGVSTLTRQVRSESFDVIYSTSSAAVNHWLALELKRRMSKNLPWVADFRDLWADDGRYREPSPQRRALHRQLEQEVREAADVVIAGPDGDSRFDGLRSESPEAYSHFELTRRLASIFDRLADRAAEAVETVQESLATCPP